ncbi:uncharacterized protein LOC123682694 [Harmonia axyridis]|uniref:uncharacterized protein LOC123682694 n=1 Tax=Harmonia axyridis TaxID=115357 RepID=UPI001E278C11|nr:uncharacterized protein LOC123682694 [Harmonia axyridis]
MTQIVYLAIVTMSQNEDNCIPEIEVLGDTQVNVQGGSNLNGDWSQYTPGQMRTPRTTILRKLPQSSVDIDENGSFVLNLEGFLSADGGRWCSMSQTIQEAQILREANIEMKAVGVR